MRQVMPHRNNIAMHRTKCKSYFGCRLFDALECGPVRCLFRVQNESDLNCVSV
jgi:hypothetical protein